MGGFMPGGAGRGTAGQYGCPVGAEYKGARIEPTAPGGPAAAIGRPAGSRAT
jgi:hypothetical protein